MNVGNPLPGRGINLETLAERISILNDPNLPSDESKTPEYTRLINQREMNLRNENINSIARLNINNNSIIK